ncbi:hypothetical protein LENED_000012 [Lentinula edodes]|uniref:Uncharacterized protein n=1 Tax=Lentinula edodes TaxID=5353 RepID=A0A1Q3DUI2_LENED|nr:hypothetical protein LENED_000012 [Lentinula edodes]
MTLMGRRRRDSRGDEMAQTATVSSHFLTPFVLKNDGRITAGKTGCDERAALERGRWPGILGRSTLWTPKTKS